jgi:hypothetical protein
VWMAPDIQELSYVKGRGRLRSCVRPFCAVTHGPLALMNSAGREKAAACVRAGTIKFTSRILEGLLARRGLVEPRDGIGCCVAH